MYSANLLGLAGRTVTGLNQRNLPVLQNIGDMSWAGGSLIPGSIFSVILLCFRRGMLRVTT